MTSAQGCALFSEFLQTFGKRKVLWSLCLVNFHPLTLKLPIQTSLSVASKLPVSLRSGEKDEKFMKISTPLGFIVNADACLVCLSPMFHVFLGSTSGATPAHLLTTSMTAKTF